MILPSEPAGGGAAKTKFSLGQLVITLGIMEVLTLEEIAVALKRHVRGNWGEVSDEDREENEYSLTHNLRVISVYHTVKGIKIWIITEHDRSSTTVLLPSEY